MIPILEYVVSPILLTGLGYVVWLLQQSKRTTDANAKGTMLLMRREIICFHKRFVENGEPMTHLSYDYINDIHDAYKALGGNSMADGLFEEIQKVKIVNPGI